MSAPAPTKTRNRRPAAGLLVALVLAAAVLAAVGCGHGQPAAPGGVAPLAASRAPLSPPVSVNLDYRTAVEQQVAARLHCGAAQIRTQLHADPNATLMTLAKALGLAQDQLAAVIVAALNDHADTALRSGTWTAQQASQEKQFWTAQTQPDLIMEISRWFRES